MNDRESIAISRDAKFGVFHVSEWMLNFFFTFANHSTKLPVGV